jgi:hypothetical protein
MAAERYVAGGNAMIPLPGATLMLFHWLEKGYEERRVVDVFKVEPMLDPVRGDPRFALWLRKMGLD